MVVDDSLHSPVMPQIQSKQRLVEVDNEIKMLYIKPPVPPPMPSLHAQSPPPGGPEVEGENHPSYQVFFPAGVVSPALISFSPAKPGVSTPAALLEPSPSAPDLQPGHPLPPPDLVDHRPNSSQPELMSDLSVSTGPSNLDQHYEFHSQAYTLSQQGWTLPLLTDHDSAHFPGQGMPDVTGGPPPQLGDVVGVAPRPEEAPVSVGQVGKAPDNLRTEPLLSPASGPPSLVPSSDRNLLRETAELTEDIAMPQVQQPPLPLASNFVAPSVTSGPASLSPMFGGNKQHSGKERTDIVINIIGY